MRRSPEGSTTISLEEAAELLGVSTATIYRAAAAEGRLAPGVPVLSIRGAKRVPRDRCERYARGELSEADSANKSEVA